MRRRWNGNQYTRRYLRRYERQAFNRAWNEWKRPVSRSRPMPDSENRPEENKSGLCLLFSVTAAIGLFVLLLNLISAALAIVAILVLIFIMLAR